LKIIGRLENSSIQLFVTKQYYYAISMSLNKISLLKFQLNEWPFNAAWGSFLFLIIGVFVSNNMQTFYKLAYCEFRNKHFPIQIFNFSVEIISVLKSAT